MAITPALCNSFKQELFVGTHNFAVAGDAFKLALFTSAATLSAATTVYSVTNEASGTGYTAGGAALTNVTPVLSASTLIVDFSSNLTWGASTITARGAQIYNTSQANKSVMVLDFGSDKSSSNGDFTVNFPVADASNAIIRMT